MSINQEHIYPVFKPAEKRIEKERFLKQQSKVLWLTGLSGAGKSTVALGIEHELAKLGYFVQILDGDNIRDGINNNLGFSLEDRHENIRRISEIAKLFKDGGIITVCCFISPTRNIREMSRKIIGDSDFIEVFLNTPLHVCEERDTKGLYKKARKGELKNFTGIDSPYEAPLNPEISVTTENESIQKSVEQVLNYILPLIEFKL